MTPSGVPTGRGFQAVASGAAGNPGTPNRSGNGTPDTPSRRVLRSSAPRPSWVSAPTAIPTRSGASTGWATRWPATHTVTSGCPGWIGGHYWKRSAPARTPWSSASALLWSPLCLLTISLSTIRGAGLSASPNGARRAGSAPTSRAYATPCGRQATAFAGFPTVRSPCAWRSGWSDGRCCGRGSPSALAGSPARAPTRPGGSARGGGGGGRPGRDLVGAVPARRARPAAAGTPADLPAARTDLSAEEAMRLCVVSFKECWQDGEGTWVSSGGFPLQMAAIGSLFDDLTLVVVGGERGEGGMPLPPWARVVPLRRPSGAGTRRKLPLSTRVPS